MESEANVSLNGTGSSDPNTEAPLNTLTYEWKQTGGTAVTLSGATTATPSFKAPKGPATLTFELKVCDGGTPPLCSTDSVTVNVREPNLAPTANAGADQTVESGTPSVSLDGSGSTDPNTEAPLNTLSYEWKQTSGTA